MAEKLKPDHWRGLDFYKPQQDTNGHVVIIGAGSIGSYAAYGLARIGVKKITVIDFDTVENHNLPNQFFAESLDLTEGLFKVIALQQTVKLMVKDANINPIPMRIENVNIKEYLPCRAVFVCVDSMDVRKWIFANKCIQDYTDLIVDARVGGLYANIYNYKSHNSTQKKLYEATLHTDSEALPLPCTGQAVADVAMCVAGEMVARYRTFAMGNIYPSLHTFCDYKFGQSWIQQTIPNVTLSTKGALITTEKNIDNLQNIAEPPEASEPTSARPDILATDDIENILVDEDGDEIPDGDELRLDEEDEDVREEEG